MPPRVPDVTPTGQQLPDHGFRLTAVRALEVAVLDHGDRGVLGTPDMVTVRVDRCGEIDDGLARAQQRAGPPTWWKQPGGPGDDPGADRRDQCRGQDAELRLRQLLAGEG